jgi:drug/metabolite transporter (DMT)-like permease
VNDVDADPNLCATLCASSCLVIVFLSSAIWGVLWVPMRCAESFGISGLWVVTLFHVLPAIVILPFIARAYIADHQHRLVLFIAGGLMGIGFVLYGLGLVVVSVVKTTVLFYLTPVWATLFAYLALYERFGLGRWLAIASGLMGCLLVMRVNSLSFDMIRPIFWGWRRVWPGP